MPVVDNFFLINNGLKNSATGTQRALQPGQTLGKLQWSSFGDLLSKNLLPCNEKELSALGVRFSNFEAKHLTVQQHKHGQALAQVKFLVEK